MIILVVSLSLSFKQNIPNFKINMFVGEKASLNSYPSGTF